MCLADRAADRGNTYRHAWPERGTELSEMEADYYVESAAYRSDDEARVYCAAKALKWGARPEDVARALVYPTLRAVVAS